MGATTLRQLLKSLCDNSLWKYAVFWKLDHQSRMLLTWEDWCYDCPKPGESIKTISDEIFNNRNEIFPTNCETSVYDGNSGGYLIGLAVADMSCLQYTLGEGVVGTVAQTGNHCWVLYDGTFAGAFNSKLLPEYPDEWLLQLAAGIKTILLVPVIPHGVVQLGSLETVAEDLVLVSHIKETFNAFQALPPSSQISILTGSLDMSSVTTNSLPNKMQFEDLKAVDVVKLTNDRLPATNQVTPPFIGQDVQSEKVPEIIGSPSKNTFGLVSMGLTEVSTFLNQSVNASEPEMTESNMFQFSCLEEELHAFSQCNNYNLGVYGESSTGNLNSYPAGGMVGEPYVNKDASEAGHRSASHSFKFPIDCELHKALGPAFYRQINENLWNSSVSGGDACGSSSLFCNKDLIDGRHSSTWQSSEWFTEGGDAKHLLEAVVANVYSGSNDVTSNGSNSFRSFTNLSGQFAASSQPHSLSEGGFLVGDDCVPQGHVTSAFVARGRNTSTNFSPSASSFKSMMSTVIDEETQKNGHRLVQSKKLYNVRGRKARTGDNHRPRPRDRQMIQDRVKELRELVPNGGKCSIDSLLDRTIKHMLFLRSITVQAEKLKQWVHKEVASQKNWKSSKTGYGHKNGSSWAFELGSELEACPIVVEDLEDSGHLLIEMLCNEHGLFLEIAQVIRSLELTILKGVMESRLNNTWAHFVVEAHRGFHRMDIFWPLMRLLQRTGSSISSRI